MYFQASLAMSDIAKSSDPGMVSNTSFSSYFNGLFGPKSSMTGIENATSSSCADGDWTYGVFRRGSKDEDSHVKRNETWAAFSNTGEQIKSLSPNIDQSTATKTEDILSKPPRPVSAAVVGEKVTFSFFKRNSGIVEETKSAPISTRASPNVSLRRVRPDYQQILPLRNGPQPGTKEYEDDLREERALHPDGKLPFSRRRGGGGLYILDDSTMSNIKELNFFMPLST